MTSPKLQFAIGSLFFAMIGCNSILGINEPIVGSTSSSSGGTGGACTIIPQSGCAESQTCVPISPTTTGCVTAGSNGEGSPCRDESLCEPGLKCYLGVCRRFCDNETPCTDDVTCGQMTLDQGGELVEVPNVGWCYVPCQFDDPEACGGYPSSGPVAGCSGVVREDDNGVVTGVTNCVTRQSEPDHTCWNQAVGAVGNGHAGDILCNPGTVCTPVGCNAPCPVGGGNTCVGGTCVSFDEPYVIYGQESGYCAN